MEDNRFERLLAEKKKQAADELIKINLGWPKFHVKLCFYTNYNVGHNAEFWTRAEDLTAVRYIALQKFPTAANIIVKVVE
jgi:hypothetical protein